MAPEERRVTWYIGANVKATRPASSCAVSRCFLVLVVANLLAVVDTMGTNELGFARTGPRSWLAPGSRLCLPHAVCGARQTATPHANDDDPLSQGLWSRCYIHHRSPSLSLAIIVPSSCCWPSRASSALSTCSKAWSTASGPGMQASPALIAPFRLWCIVLPAIFLLLIGEM